MGPSVARILSCPKACDLNTLFSGKIKILVVTWIYLSDRRVVVRILRVSFLGIIFSKTGRRSGQQASIIAVLAWALAQRVVEAILLVVSRRQATPIKEIMRKTAIMMFLFSSYYKLEVEKWIDTQQPQRENGCNCDLVRATQTEPPDHKMR